MVDLQEQNKRQKRVNEIMSSDKTLFDKMQTLTLDSDFDDDLSLVMTVNGPELKNVLYRETMQASDGLSMSDFINDYACYFEALQKCLYECDRPENKVVRERFADDIADMREAVSLWTDLQGLTNVPDSRSTPAERQAYYQAASEFINKHSRSQSDPDYVRKQQAVIADFFLRNTAIELTEQEYDFYKKLLADSENGAGGGGSDILGGASPAVKTTSPALSAKQKEMHKKIRLNGIICLSVAVAFSAAAFIVGIFQPLVSCCMLALGGIAEVVTAVVLWKSVNRKIRFTCPACGTKRVMHRTLIEITTKDTNTQKTARTNSGSAYTLSGVRTDFTQHYEECYVCPDCGETYTRTVKRGGGYYIEYNDGSVSDHRIAPLADC